MEPKYKVGQRVRYDNRTGIIRKVWTTDPNETKYTVDFLPGKHILTETQITKA
ncbi:hypothetical protein SEA_BELFORT_204 [Streptomyces phage Belfort]|uniref:Uncharacterized protein n=1 Tax=Streptomyces phage Belfort TaxID=2801887 RepID=A0A7T8C5S8_9CAUD|nr:hypothetical protein SEA_BELFORT_204 [Streptomyces phage Belfort]